MLCYNKYERRGGIKLKKQTGITLISLVITIIVMIIIAGVATTAGLSSIENAKKTSLITELEMIQEKVNTICEKRKLNKEDITYYDSLGKDISSVDEEKLNVLLDGIEQIGYRYFSKEDLKQLELDNMTQDVIINYDTRDVASISGITIDGETYYRLSDIPDYPENNVEYNNKNIHAPTFEVQVNKLSNSWQFVIKNIVYNSNVASGIISYKLQNEENWIIVGEEKYFEVAQKRNV